MYTQAGIIHFSSCDPSLPAFLVTPTLSFFLQPITAIYDEVFFAEEDNKKDADDNCKHLSCVGETYCIG